MGEKRRFGIALATRTDQTKPRWAKCAADSKVLAYGYLSDVCVVSQAIRFFTREYIDEDLGADLGWKFEERKFQCVLDRPDDELGRISVVLEPFCRLHCGVRGAAGENLVHAAVKSRFSGCGLMLALDL